jgi:hypothetical protein
MCAKWLSMTEIQFWEMKIKWKTNSKIKFKTIYEYISHRYTKKNLFHANQMSEHLKLIQKTIAKNLASIHIVSYSIYKTYLIDLIINILQVVPYILLPTHHSIKKTSHPSDKI